MAAEKCRILICPSDQSDVNDATALDGDADVVNQIRPGPGAPVAIFGWVDETDSAITIIAIGSIPLTLPVSSSAVRTSEGETDSLDVATICDQTISPAINRLSKQHPCQHSTSTHSHRCGHCCECTTYQSVRVLGIVRNPIGQDAAHDKTDTKEVNSDIQKSRHQRQIITYDQTEARKWHSQYNNLHAQQHYPAGTWQRNSLRMGEALNVMENLVLAMNNVVEQCPTEENDDADADDTMSMEKEERDHPTIIGRSGKKEQSTAPSQDTSFGGIWNQSLLLLHLKQGTQQLDMGDTTHNILTHIPLYSVIQHLLHQHGSSSKSQLSGSSRGSTHHAKSLFIALLLDSLLGLTIGYILLRHPLPIIQRVIFLWKSFQDQQLREGLKWLESFPAGFKLNVALTHQMGNEVRLAVQYHQKIVSFLFPTDACIEITAATVDAYNTAASTVPANLVKYLGLFTIIFGSRFFFALAFDITRLALLHIHYLSSLFAACQRLELSTLTSLWLLFRGKKRNILRRRSDHLKYDHMQLLLGMILFTICLFMLTTILVYHCFFAIINHVAELCVCGTWWCGFMAVEGVMQCDVIVMENRRSQNGTKDLWIGAGMQFVPIDLSDVSHIGYFLGNDLIMASDNAKIPVLNEPTLLEDGPEESAKNLFSQVSISHQRISTMQVVFPAKSGQSIIINAYVSFIASKLSKTVTFFKRLMLGTHCPVASTYVEISRSAR